MSSSKSKSFRDRFRDAQTEADPLDRTPVEVPLDARAPGRSIEQEIQRQIAMIEAKKASGASN